MAILAEKWSEEDLLLTYSYEVEAPSLPPRTMMINDMYGMEMIPQYLIYNNWLSARN